MGHNIASNARIGHLRNQAMTRLMPDTYRLYAPIRTVDDLGMYVDEYDEPMLYEGIPDIPCRLDVSNHYRSAAVFGQEAIVSDYVLFVPFDAPMYSDYKLIINGEQYEIRKMLDTFSWNVTKMILVSRLDL